MLLDYLYLYFFTSMFTFFLIIFDKCVGKLKKKGELLGIHQFTPKNNHISVEIVVIG